jgi:hypothetical protein
MQEFKNNKYKVCKVMKSEKFCHCEERTLIPRYRSGQASNLR